MRVERTRQLQELSPQSAAGPCTGSCSLTMSLVSSSAGQYSDQDIIHTFFSKQSRPSVQHQYSYIVQPCFISQLVNWFELWKIWAHVTIYAAGVLFPLFWVWSCDDKHSGHLTLDLPVIRAVTRRMWRWLLNCTPAWESHSDAPGHRDKCDNQIMLCLLLGIGLIKQSRKIISILVVLVLLYEQNVRAFKWYYAYLILYKRYLMNSLNRGRRQIAKTILAHCTAGLDGLPSITLPMLCHIFAFKTSLIL